jgi:hypothetical protein
LLKLTDCFVVPPRNDTFFLAFLDVGYGQSLPLSADTLNYSKCYINARTKARTKLPLRFFNKKYLIWGNVQHMRDMRDIRQGMPCLYVWGMGCPTHKIPSLNYPRPYAQNPTSSFFSKKINLIWKNVQRGCILFREAPQYFALFSNKKPKN